MSAFDERRILDAARERNSTALVEALWSYAEHYAATWPDLLMTLVLLQDAETRSWIMSHVVLVDDRRVRFEARLAN